MLHVFVQPVACFTNLSTVLLAATSCTYFTSCFNDNLFAPVDSELAPSTSCRKTEDAPLFATAVANLLATVGSCRGVDAMSTCRQFINIHWPRDTLTLTDGGEEVYSSTLSTWLAESPKERNEAGRMQLEKFDRAPPTIKSYDNKRSGHLTGGAEGVTCSPPLKFRKKIFFFGQLSCKIRVFC